MNKLMFIILGVVTLVATGLFVGSDDSNAEVVASGSCGTDLTWEYDDATTTLTIKGTGTTMSSWYDGSSTPWKNYRSNVTQVIIDAPNLQNIGEHAFEGCSNLQNVTFSENIQSMSSSAFASCSKLNINRLPDTVTVLESNVFVNDSNLALTTLPSNLTEIGYGCFQNCTKLAISELPSGLTSISGNAFYNCKLSTITSIPDGVTSIGKQALYQVKVPSLYIPSSVTSIGESVCIMNGGPLYYNVVDCTYTGTRTPFGIPSDIYIGENVESIPNLMFYSTYTADVSSCVVHFNAVNCADFASSSTVFGNPYMDTVIFGDNVKRIPAYFGKGIGSTLTSVSLNDELEEIGAGAFTNCTGINSILISDKVTTIGAGAFTGSGIESASIPQNFPVENDVGLIGITHLTIRGSESPVAYTEENYVNLPQYTSRATLTDIYLQDIEYIAPNTFKGIEDVDNKLHTDDESIWGWSGSATKYEHPDFINGSAGYPAKFQSATTSIPGLPDYKLNNVQATMKVGGSNFQLEPTVTVYPAEYNIGTDGGMAGKILSFVPVLIVVGILMLVVGIAVTGRRE